MADTFQKFPGKSFLGNNDDTVLSSPAEICIQKCIDEKKFVYKGFEYGYYWGVSICNLQAIYSVDGKFEDADGWSHYQRDCL
jgi:hypothetical protein